MATIGRIAPLAALALALATACTKVGSGGAGAPDGASNGGAQTNAFSRPHVLRWSEAEDVAGLNPHIVAQANVSYLSEMTMAYLARYDRKNQPIPELATVIPTQRNGGISADGKTIVWHLRRGVRWSDGAPFGADDVKFSFQAVLNPKNNEIGRDGFDLITRVDEPDKYTIVLKLKKPFASFLPLYFGTAGANPCLLPKHILGSLPNINTAPYNSLPVGIGPFRYKTWKRGDEIVLERNPYYWRGTPKLERVEFKIIPDRNTVLEQIQSGGLDLWALVGAGYVERVSHITGYRLLRRPSAYYDHIDFNVQRPIGRDPIVRAALRYAMDRPTLIAKANHGVGLPSESVVVAASPAYDKKLDHFVAFDLAKANAMLEAGGWKRGTDGIRVKNGLRLALEFATGTGQPDVDTRIELVRSTWAKVGAAIDVHHYLPSVMFAPFADNGLLYRGRFDAITFAWGGDVRGDVSTQYECTQIAPNGQNDSRYCNRAVDAAMERFKMEYDPAASVRADAFVQEQIARDVPVIVLDTREDLYAANDDLVGFEPNAATPFDDMMNVDVR